MRFEAPKGWILVSKLSHGLRAMYLADGMERKFEGETHQVSISDGFYNEIQAALQVDKKFQERLIEYEALMSDHQ